ncbi:MAG: phosphatase PAP2 family protein [Chthoniobacterales bacterium]
MSQSIKRGILAGFCLFLLVAAFFLDARVDHWTAAHRFPGLQEAATFWCKYLAWPWLMLYAGVGWLVAWRWGRKEGVRVLCAMMIAASLAGLSADLGRGLTGRTRPYNESAPQGWYGVRRDGHWLIGRHAFNSFPSGHTAAISGFLVPLVCWRRRWAALVFPLIGIMAAARVYLRAHHLSDVTAGAMLGALVAYLVWRRFVRARALPEPA